MKKSLLCIVSSLAMLPTLSYANSPYFSLKQGDGFKRFSISVGALHIMPQGKAQLFQVNIAVKNGAIQFNTVINNLNPEANQSTLAGALNFLGFLVGDIVV